MAVQYIKCDWLALPGGKLERFFFITLQGDKITSIAQGGSPDYPENCDQYVQAHLVIPGFIDLHTHGVGGKEDVLDFWQNPEYAQLIFPKQGTTSFLATVIFPRDYPEKTSTTLSRLAECVGKTGQGAVLEGIHAEGPIVNDLGAMPTTDAEMSLDDFEKLLDSIPSLKVMTISPHIQKKDNYMKIKALLKRGVLPALGHDRVANEEEILGALSCSPQKKMHITHLFNVCSFHHRSPSLVNFGLTSEFPALPQYNGLVPPTVELIGDMAHVHPMVLSMVLKARNFRDIIFVTDSVMEPKPGAVVSYVGRKLQVADDGRSLSLVGENVLAGSCCSLLDTLQTLVNVLQVPLGEAIAMLTENPARIVGLKHIGTVEVGKRADLLLLDQDLNLKRTIVAGDTVYTSDS